MTINEQLSSDVQDLKVQYGKHEERIGHIEKDIEQLQVENKAIYEINTNVRLLAEGMSSVKDDVAAVKEDVKKNNAQISKLDEKFDDEQSKLRDEVNDIRSMPDKAKAAWWDKVVWLIVGGAISAVVTAIIALIWK